MKLSGSSISRAAIIVLFLVSCSRGESLCKKEFEDYVFSTENGLLQTKVINGQLKIVSTYQPASLLFYGDSTHVISNEDSLLRFKLSILYEGAHAIDFLGIAKILDEQVVNSSDWFKMETKKKVYPALFVQPISYYGTVSQMDYLLVFGADGLSEEEEINILFSPTSEKLSFLRSNFRFSMNDIYDIPLLKMGC